MSQDPNHPMDELLKTYAKARQDQFGPATELPPPMRKALQEEVGLAFGQTLAEVRASFWEIFLPRLGFAAVAFAGIVIAVTLFEMQKPFAPEVPTSLANSQDLGFRLAEQSAGPEIRSADPTPEGLSEVLGRDKPAPREEAALSLAGASPASTNLLAYYARGIAGTADGFGVNGAADRSKGLSLGTVVAGDDYFAKLKPPSNSPVLASLSDELQVEQIGEARPSVLRSVTPAPPAAPRPSAAAPIASPLAQGAASVERERAESNKEAVESRPLAEREDLASRNVLADREADLGRQQKTENAQAPSLQGGLAELRRAGGGATDSPGQPSAPQSPRESTVSLFSTSATEAFELVQVEPPARYRLNFQSPPLPDLLKKFRLERSENKVRLVDADGSIYEGQVVASASAGKPPSVDGSAVDSDALRRLDAVTSTSSGLGNGRFEFQVSGTNRVSNQSVTIAGVFVPASGVAGEIAPNKSAADLSGRPSAPAEGAPAADPRVRATRAGRVQARASVGGTNQLEIEAVTSPQR